MLKHGECNLTLNIGGTILTTTMMLMKNTYEVYCSQNQLTTTYSHCYSTITSNHEMTTQHNKRRYTLSLKQWGWIVWLMTLWVYERTCNTINKGWRDGDDDDDVNNSPHTTNNNKHTTQMHVVTVQKTVNTICLMHHVQPYYTWYEQQNTKYNKWFSMHQTTDNTVQHKTFTHINTVFQPPQ